MAHTDRKYQKVTNMRIEYMSWAQEKILYIAHWQKNIRKGNEYAYIEYLTGHKRKKILQHTLIENIKRVTNMRIEYMNWVQEKILYNTLVGKYQKG